VSAGSPSPWICASLFKLSSGKISNSWSNWEIN
jgi:hypothetical protein